ncbi:hypothetical protein ABPG77_011000 [Micractinium sp. CCAP 211/92]
MLSIPLATELAAAAAVAGLAGTAAPSALAAVRLAGLALQRVLLASYASPTRGELRQAEGIPGSAATDWVLWCLLPQCMLCQEASQLADRQQRGAALHTRSSTGTATLAPAQQVLVSRLPAHTERPVLRSSSSHAALPRAEPPHEQFVVAVGA